MPYIYYLKNSTSHIIELYFEKIPAASVRQQLKQHFWRWNPDKKCWYSMLNQSTEAFAKQLGAVETSDQHEKNVSVQQKSTTNAEMLKLLRSFGYESMSVKQLEQIIVDLNGPVPTPISADQFNQEDGIAVVLFGLSGEIMCIRIVEDVDNQDSANGIYWIERTISQKIIYGIINKKPWVFYKNELYLIKFYSDTKLLRSIVMHSRYFSENQDAAEIWIYSMKMPCPRHPKSIESVTACIPVTGTSRACQINVYYCPVCRKYYINSKQYHDFAQRYGLPNVRLKVDRSDDHAVDFSAWREESILHVMGYNVSDKDGLSDDERHKILLHALNTKTLSKSEIISFLEFLQYRNEGNLRFDNACSKWHEDADFVRNYSLDTQRKVTGKFKAKNS